MKYPAVQNKQVLITGCSSGIGYVTAHYLREMGWHAIPTARKGADLEKLTSEGFDAVELDLLKPESVERALSQTLELTGGKLGGLVNNAGFAQPGAIEDLARDAMQRQFEVNVFGMQQLTNGLIPLFRSQGWGRIVNVSSVFGRITVPMVGCYCASKYAMEALSDAMRLELCRAGVGVSLIEPGAIISRFRDNAADMATQTLDVENTQFSKAYQRAIKHKKNKAKKPSFLVRPPEDVAKKIYHALESPQPHARYCVTPAAYFAAFMRRFAPTWFLDAILVKRVGK